MNECPPRMSGISVTWPISIPWLSAIVSGIALSPIRRIFKEALKFGRWISWNGVYDRLSWIGKVEIHLSRCLSNIQYLQLPRATSAYESQLVRFKLSMETLWATTQDARVPGA